MRQTDIESGGRPAAGYVRRKPLKSIATGSSPHRKEQFRIVLFLVALFHDMEENPMLSIDTKKKELLGELSRHETVLTTPAGVAKVYSADYPYLASGRAVPHGIYDVKLNKGYISLGSSNETAPRWRPTSSWTISTGGG